jgi:pimeloyl-ACP methyl ester carboxylesterase
MTFQPLFERFRWLASGVVVSSFLTLALGEFPAQAQDPTPPKADPAAKEAPAKEGAKAPADANQPEQIELLTKDDIRLKATYYPSTKGKDAIPVIILHDSKTDSRNAYHTLALALQADGEAVLVPDMRGYGESTKIKQGPGIPDKEFDAKKMSSEAYNRMVTTDMEKLKSFLKGKNDDGKLNLNQLCVIGIGDLGSSIAVNWTFGDWNFKDLNTIKQSKDVHALILISPDNFKNLQIPKILTPLAKIQGPNQLSSERLSFFFVVGAGKPGAVVKPKEWRTVKGFADTVERFHPAPPKNLIKADKTLFFGEMPTTLQAGDLLSPAMLNTPIQIEGFQPVPLQAMILTFIDWRLREKAVDFQWSSRKVPGG